MIRYISLLRFMMTLACLAMPASLFAQGKSTAVQATDLTKEFATDEQAANKKYNLKTVTVEGVVDSFPKNKEGKKDILLKGHEAGTSVFCYELPADEVEKLKAGDKVKVSGICAGKVGPYIALGGCKFVADSGTTTPKKTPPEAKKESVVRGKPVTGLVTTANKGWKVVGIEPKLAYISDRNYNITTFPKELAGAHVILRDSGEINDWLGKGKLTLAKDATLYVAMLVNADGKDILTKKQLDAMAADGWTFLNEPFETTTPDKSWAWRVAKKSIKKGDVDIPLPKEFSGGFRTHVIYMVK